MKIGLNRIRRMDYFGIVKLKLYIDRSQQKDIDLDVITEMTFWFLYIWSNQSITRLKALM